MKEKLYSLAGRDSSHHSMEAAEAMFFATSTRGGSSFTFVSLAHFVALAKINTSPGLSLFGYIAGDNTRYEVLNN